MVKQAGKAKSQHSQGPHPWGAEGEQPTNGRTTTLQIPPLKEQEL